MVLDPFQKVGARSIVPFKRGTQKDKIHSLGRPGLICCHGVNMKFKCITCDALARQTYHCAAQSPHLIDVELVSMGQHIKPEQLNRTLQDKIDSVKDTTYNAILLCYGLCGQATSGLTARDIPVVIPRAHDCITLCLGSKEEYKKQQEICPGTIWYTKDYLERLDNAKEFSGMGASSAELYDEKAYEAMVGRMGKETAGRIIASMGEMTKNYERVVFIEQDMVDSKKEQEFIQKEAGEKGWRFEKMKGDTRLIKGLLNGDWPEEGYLLVKPGQKIIIGFGDRIVKVAEKKDKDY